MIAQKWKFQRDTWRMTINRGEDIRGDLEELEVPYCKSDEVRKQLKNQLRQDRSENLGNFISLEQTLDLCREIWFEPESGDEADDQE